MNELTLRVTYRDYYYYRGQNDRNMGNKSQKKKKKKRGNVCWSSQENVLRLRSLV